MIAAWSLFILGSGLRIAEFSDPQQKTVCVSAVVRLPSLSPKGVAAARALVEELRDGSAAYGRSRWVGEGALVGVLPSVELSSDAIVVRLASAPRRHRVVASLLADLLRSPAASQEAAMRAIERAREDHRTSWEQGLDPRREEWQGLDARVLSHFARWLPRPERVAVAISGPFLPGEGRKALEVRLEDWKGTPGIPEPRELLGASPSVQRSGGPLVVRWTVPWSDLSDRGMGQVWLVASALGSGKGGTLFRAWRVEDGFSYRQECRIEGAPEGVSLRVLVAKARDEGGLTEAWRKLRAAVEAWTEGDRLRALAMMGRRSSGPYPDGVLGFLGPDPASPDPLDQSGLAAYWAAKTGRPLDLGAWLREARAMPLEEMRSLALRLLSEAQMEGSVGSSNSG